VAVDGVIGLISLLTTPESGRRLGPHDLALAEELGLRAALALQNARHHREAREALVAQERALKALERSNRELDQFAYVASHDLKAPLRGIASLSQWIEEGVGDKLGDEDREHLRLLRGRVSRLEALIDGILSYSRAGRTREARENVDVAHLLAELVDLIAAPAGARIEIGPGMPSLYAERAPLQQVLMNLIGNAIKHAGRADAVVKVTCEETPEAYDFAVSDNGPGIAPQFHERIWVIFQTLQARDKVEGTGIGLSVVKKIVEARGGRVTVDSREGAGATFHVFWPRRAEEPS
jgi:light-regulated signal transduction histidine kinase (bacteriophytochrome)